MALAAGVTVPIAATTTEPDLHGLEAELELAGDDPRHVEELVDDLVLRVGIPDDRLDGGGDLRVIELAALEQVSPPDDRGQWRPQLVRQGGQELVLHPPRRLGHPARLLRLLVEVRVVDGDGRVGREAGDEALVARVEDAGVRMPEEEAAQEVAGPGAHGRGEVAPRRREAGGHLPEGEVRAEARVAGEVVAARGGALERRSEGLGILGQGEIDEGLRGSPRDGVGPDAGPVPVEEGPESGPGDRDAGVGHGLDQAIQVEMARQRQPQPVEGRDLRSKLLGRRRRALALGLVARRAELSGENADHGSRGEDDAEEQESRAPRVPEERERQRCGSGKDHGQEGDLMAPDLSPGPAVHQAAHALRRLRPHPVGWLCNRRAALRCARRRRQSGEHSQGGATPPAVAQGVGPRRSPVCTLFRSDFLHGSALTRADPA